LTSCSTASSVASRLSRRLGTGWTTCVASPALTPSNGRGPRRNTTQPSWGCDWQPRLDRHPWAVAGFFRHPSNGRNATRVGEHALEILTRTRFSNESIVAIFGGMLALNYGWSAFAAARDVLTENAAEQVRQAMVLLPYASW
jgi:hypothetical protein